MKFLSSLLVGAAVAGFAASATADDPAAAAAAAADAAAGAGAAANATDANETVVAKVAPSQLRQNFNSDRTEAWGDIELVGGGQKWEYVKGLFGGPLTCRPQRIVMAEPRLGCEPLTNSADELADAMVIISRGECSFADKVRRFIVFCG